MIAIPPPEPVRVELVCCEMVLMQHIATKECKQKDLAFIYAAAICSSEAKDHIDWRRVNDAIEARWSKSAVTRVKEMAWKIIEQNNTSAAAS